jgi:hypothetical protein
MATSRLKEALHCDASARVIVSDAWWVECLDRTSGGGIHSSGRVVVEVVAEVGADYDQGFVTAPTRVQRLSDLLWGGLAHGDRQEGEAVQHLLKKGELNLEGVFPVVGFVQHMDVRQTKELLSRCRIDGNASKGRFESRVTRNSEPTERNVMARSKEHHPFDPVGSLLE